MPDEFRFAMLPIEKNGRRLIEVLVQHFPTGGTSEDLRRQFEKDTGLVRQSFYNALRYSKQQGWLVGGPRHRRELHRLYHLASDGSWKPPQTSVGEPVREPLSRDQLEYLADTRAQQIGELQGQVECLRDWSSGSNGEVNIALASLVSIVSDNAASTRQRIKAAAAVLGYKVQDNGVVEFTKRYLQSVCASAEISNIDYKIEAGELLRKHEAPRVVSESVRPSYRDDEPGEPPEPLAQLVARRRQRQDALEREEIERELGLPPGGAAGIADPTDYLLTLRRAIINPNHSNGDDESSSAS